ncbi:hypothetical protein BOTBODRAFT_38109 [Botryobasidium botryosum FD-172 SS1]|uniref:arginyltransferase n=1 Tax=Botryobasidium botryosum (strain FD-172 SS1) TaxID=930990 RepID=A0A067LYG3_BOTB1|nr:hypothetical protein BOTBODRAFT_38109 [Botryobasidium botryosum FD-172 SS1]
MVVPICITILDPAGPSRSTCGYCSEPGQRSAKKTSFSTGSFVSQLSCPVYMDMLDRGWRRSGEYLYKPNMKKTCCPQYTIRLDALTFGPSKSLRKLLGRWNRYVLLGESSGAQSAKQKGDSAPASFVDALHASEATFLKPGTSSKYRFEVTLEESTFTEEKYSLYHAYQRRVHKDERDTPSSFTRFLVDSPLVRQPIEYPSLPPPHLPKNYGSYHQMYRLDGELIAIGFIDILPACVSSVYFVYGEKWEWASFGKLSAMREVSLAREIHEAGVEEMKYLYMGFYIYSCPKMRYKGEYSPSFLLDPESYLWHPLEAWKPLLETHRYASISFPERSMGAITNGEADDSSSEDEDDHTYPLDLALKTLPESLWDEVMIVSSASNGQVYVTPASRWTHWKHEGYQTKVVSMVEALGVELAKAIILNP